MRRTVSEKTLKQRIKKIVENAKYALDKVKEKIMVRIYGKYFVTKINRITPKGVWVNVP